ncbi:MAG TPA: tRNA 5'-guanylyltransferase [Methanocorpusculum sp.]|nr:tRNA 5'-guanylyltransferase [Candidatus Methanocorpusculum equi]HJJ32817.1 tRNA 5'-guanylyltransferase [Methanocorpusculum sp.]
MKDREIFSRLTTTMPFVIRLDGRSFHTVSADFRKPFDEKFSDLFVKTAELLFSKSGLSPDLIYTFSDEISLFITKPVFDCRVEKLVSVSAGFASSAFTMEASSASPLAFDARIIPVSESQFPAYLAWRQAEAWRNHINGYCQKILTDSGLSAAAAQKKLNGLNAEKLHELAFSNGINLAKTPAWERRGIALYWGADTKDGYNPLTGESVQVIRNTVVIDRNLPLFKTGEGANWVFSKILVPPTCI